MPVYCVFNGCGKRSGYSYAGQSALYCKSHKLEGMIDVIHKKCEFSGCETRACYNYIGMKSGVYCKRHKLENMEDVTSQNCIHTDCVTRACYNYEHLTTPLYCVTHKLENMVDIRSQQCEYEGCTTQPIYNYETEKKPKYCKMHKLTGMVDIKNKNQTCAFAGCESRANYNTIGCKKALYCAIHKNPDMENVISHQCKFDGCTKLPTYNYEYLKGGLYCVQHKLPNMVDVVHKMCKNEWCKTRANPKEKDYEGYCVYCYINMFPEKALSKNYKTKETAVVEYIKSNFVGIDIVYDKQIQNGCSKRRPDILIDLGYQVIIVEIDENQHFDYDCSCENKRIMELSQDVQHRPIVFIRFNPDAYIYKDQNIPSCWSLNKGICHVKKQQQKEWNNRLNCLKTTIEYWLDPKNITNKIIETVHLYYDVD